MSPARNDRIEPRRTTVRAEDMKFWAQLLRDPNPLHLDPRAVSAKGLGERVINQGPANAALLIDLLLIRFPGARIADVEFRFLDNLFAGDIATAEGVVTEAHESANQLHVACELRLHVDGRDVLAGRATFDVFQSGRRDL